MIVALLLLAAGCAQSAVVSPAVVQLPPSTSIAPATSTTVTSAPTTVSSSSTTTLPGWETTIVCFAESPPPYAGYEFDDDFYAHWCSASGIPVIGSADVPLVSLEAAAQVVNGVIGYDPVNTAQTIANGGVVILYGPHETAADLPEWAYVAGQTTRVSEDHPGFTSVGGGITFSVVVWDDPVCAVPVERQDAYGTGEWGSVLVHELGHLVAGPTTRSRLVDFMDNNVTAAYQVALASGFWDADLYAMSSPAEYWAEATQIYLGQYSSSTAAANMPRTRVELAQQDPLITTLLRTVYGQTTRLGTYWCGVYKGPVTLLPDESASEGYAAIP
jgi:hypothetical protein